MARQIETLSLADARQLITGAENKALELKIPFNIAVVDATGALLAHVRMDGAWLGSVDISINKAWTARAFDMSTEDLSQASQSGGSLFGINSTNQGRVVIFGGGIPVRLNGTVVGAVGVSGSSVDNDIRVAKAAVDAYIAAKPR